MSGRPTTVKRRFVARTLLLVGEGNAELVWLRHVKSLYVARGAGLVVSLKNAHGKGAGHVVDVAIRQSRNYAYDAKAVLLDTDTDWTEQVRARAKKECVEIVTAIPCLEGMLLSAHGHQVEGMTSAKLKSDFAVRFGMTALEAKTYEQYFPRIFLEKARTKFAQIDQLLNLLST
jgi:hypothetical protein